MAGYKEYKSVTEFPLHVEKLDRDELEAAYRELRDTYRSLVISRGQLVRRQTEAKSSLTVVNQKLQHISLLLEKAHAEKLELQKSLAHSVELQKQLQSWGDELTQEVNDLSSQIGATTKLLQDFESVYEEVKEESGIFSIWNRFTRLLTAANRLLNTDLKTLMPQKRAEVRPEDDPDAWKRQTPADINRSLLDK